MKTFCSANNVYFIKNKYFFKLSFATNEQSYVVNYLLALGNQLLT